MDEAIEQSVAGHNAVSAQSAFPIQAMSEMFADVQGRTLRQISRMNGHCIDLLDQLHTLQQMDLAFSTKLVSCRSPAEAAALCGEWTIKTFDAFGAAQCCLLEFWSAMGPDSTAPSSNDGGRQ